MKFDLSKFKKISSDSKSTKLKHPDGHEIIVAHVALSPKMRAELRALPKYEGGGAVKDPISGLGPDKPGSDAYNAHQGISQGFGQPSPEQSPDPYKEAKGGMIKRQGNPKLAESKKQPPRSPFNSVNQLEQDDRAPMQRFAVGTPDAPIKGTSEGYTVRPEGDDVTMVPAKGNVGVPGSKYPPSGGYGGGDAKVGNSRKPPGDDEAYADGGSVQQPADDNSPLATVGTVLSMLAKGGYLKKMADGGDVEQPKDDNNPIAALAPLLALLAKGGYIKGYAAGGPVAPESGDQEEDPRLAELADQAANGEGDQPDDEQEGPAPASSDQQQEAPQPQQPPENAQAAMTRKRAIYNQKLSGNFDPSAPSNLQGFTFGPNGEPPSHFNPKVWNQAESQYNFEQQDHAVAAGKQAMAAEEDNRARQQAGLPPAPGYKPPEAAAQKAASVPPPVSGAVGARPLSPAENYMSNMQQSAQQGANAIGSQQQATEQLGSGQEDAADATAHRDVGLARQSNPTEAPTEGRTYDDRGNPSMPAQNSADMMQDYNHWVGDLRNGYVDPNKFIDNQGSGRKVRSAIGLILGGLGSGLTGGPNFALEYLNAEKNRDIQKMQNNKDIGNSVLAHNYQQFGNMQTAIAQTHLMYNAAYQHMLDQNLDANATPQAKAAAEAAKAKWTQENALWLQSGQAAQQRDQAAKQNMNGQQGASNGRMGLPMAQTNSGPNGQMIDMMRRTNPQVAQSYASRYYPPTDELASRDLDPKTVENLKAQDDFDQSAKSLLDWANKNSGSITPKKRAEGEAMALEVQRKFGAASGGGVPTEGRTAEEQKVVGAKPGEFLNDFRGYQSALQTVINANQRTMRINKAAAGLNPNAQAKYMPSMGQETASQPRFTPKK